MRNPAVPVIVYLAAVCAYGTANVQSAHTVAKVQGLFTQLQTAQQQKARGQQPQRVTFQFTEAELNEYMSHALKATPRPGVRGVTIKLFPNNYISTYTVVDFDAVERWKPGTVPALLRPVLNGQKAVWVDYRFRAEGGTATFTVEKAYFQNIRIPAFVVEKMIGVVAARQPEKYDTSKPLPLPFGLRQVSTSDKLVRGAN